MPPPSAHSPTRRCGLRDNAPTSAPWCALNQADPTCLELTHVPAHQDDPVARWHSRKVAEAAVVLLPPAAPAEGEPHLPDVQRHRIRVPGIISSATDANGLSSAPWLMQMRSGGVVLYCDTAQNPNASRAPVALCLGTHLPVPNPTTAASTTPSIHRSLFCRPAEGALRARLPLGDLLQASLSEARQATHDLTGARAPLPIEPLPSVWLSAGANPGRSIGTQAGPDTQPLQT